MGTHANRKKSLWNTAVKKMVSVRTLGSAGLLLLLLCGSTAAYADTNSSNLTLSVASAVTNLGTQQYTVSGGQVVYASINGYAINPATAQLQFSVSVTQSGLNTYGTGSFQLSGTTSTSDGDNDGAGDGDGDEYTNSVTVGGQIAFGGAIPAAALPLGCTTTCTSVLPFSFVGGSNVQEKIGWRSTTVPETMQVESPYFNPWGAPIVLASADNSIVIVTTYTQGTIVWTGIQSSGPVSGNYGSNQISGQFAMSSQETENLVTGAATDSGNISFSSMTKSSLNENGTYSGSSTIPAANALDCSAATGIPGTCAQTGFQSQGTFSMKQWSHSIKGGYATAWGMPALGAYSTISATVSSYDD